MNAPSLVERDRPHRRGLAPLVVLLCLWLWAVTQLSDAGPGIDCRTYLAAAQVLAHGGNPYDHAALLRQAHGLVPASDLVRVGEPPLIFWVLEPLARLPVRGAWLLWLLASVLLALAGIWGVLRSLGWERALVPAALFLAMPFVVVSLLSGNLVLLAFAAVGVGLGLLHRYPLLSGIVLSVAWVKPQVALPLAMLSLLFLCPAVRAGWVGFVIGTVAQAAVTLAVLGPMALAWWVRGVLAFSQTIPEQGDTLSLSGLYVRWAPGAVSTVLDLTLMVAGLAVIAWVLWRTPRPVPLAAVGWLWVLWLLVAPYDRYGDTMFVAAPVLALIARDGVRPATAALLYAGFGGILLSNWFPSGVCLLPLVAVAACAVLVREAGRPALQPEEPREGVPRLLRRQGSHEDVGV